MRTSRIQKVTRIAIAVGMAAPLVASCSLLAEGDGPKGPVIKNCPTELEEIVKGHWGLKKASDDQIRAGLLAAYYTESLSFRVEGDTEKGCKGIATALGASAEQLKVTEKEPGSESKKYCEAATTVVDAAESATKGNLVVEAADIDCVVDVELYEDCVKQCAPGYKVTATSLECDGRMMGVCEGSCEGNCYSSVGKCSSTCEGTCNGACDGAFKGECSGTCNGTCDGKPLAAKAKGKCTGVCEGSCNNGAGECGGTCNGNCSGKCETEASGPCAGTCSGHCDGTLSEKVCEGTVSVPELDTACQVVCGTKGLLDTRCKDLKVTSRIESTETKPKGKGKAKPDEGAEKLKSAMYANLPKLFVLTQTVDKPSREYLEKAGSVVSSMAAAVKADPRASKELKACTAQSEKSQKKAAAGIVAALDALASFRATSGI